MKRCYSLKRNKEFRYAYRVGKSAGSKSMVLIYAKGRPDEIKIGFSVSKKIGNAVIRNRIKRRLREAVTPLIPGLKKGYKLIIIAKPPIKDEKLPSIISSMRYMVRKANLFAASGNENLKTDAYTSAQPEADKLDTPPIESSAAPDNTKLEYSPN